MADERASLAGCFAPGCLADGQAKGLAEGADCRVMGSAGADAGGNAAAWAAG
jgi:hypothetical protein